jgi:hypothetical protein
MSTANWPSFVKPVVARIVETSHMDRSAAMPRRAWVEIRDPQGRLLRELPATITGGGISAEIPGFPPNTIGRIEVHSDPEEGLADDAELEPLPTSPQLLLYQIG